MRLPKIQQKHNGLTSLARLPVVMQYPSLTGPVASSADWSERPWRWPPQHGLSNLAELPVMKVQPSHPWNGGSIGLATHPLVIPPPTAILHQRHAVSWEDYPSQQHACQGWANRASPPWVHTVSGHP